MKAYFIFAIALTVAYIIYYAVMIARDLYGKNGEKIKSGEEEFDVSDFDEEESVSVVENDKGFNIGDTECVGGNKSHRRKAETGCHRCSEQQGQG